MKKRKLICAWLGVMVMLAGMAAAQVATTTVSDMVFNANGTPAQGTVLISWPQFTTANGITVAAGSTSATLTTGGGLSVALAPNAGATPIGSYYSVVYHLAGSGLTQESWVVPVSSTAVKLTAVRSTVLPASVAMQTVTKQYVDNAIASAMATGVIPTANDGTFDPDDYVLIAGDTMTGPLVLPGDPTSDLQAADKHYVDTGVAGVAAGMAQTVSTLPSATQTVNQPLGSTLGVSDLNGEMYATEALTGTGSDGIANATASSNCTGGCDVTAEPTYPGTESLQPYWMKGTYGFPWNAQTHVKDERGGRVTDSFMNPHNVLNDGDDSAETIIGVTTNSAAAMKADYNSEYPASTGLTIMHEGLTGGNNIFPVTTAPYFKSGYSALHLMGHYNTPGQHILDDQQIYCYGVGDCLMGSHTLVSSGGFRDNADEGAHPYDLLTTEDTVVFQGTCGSGCTTASTQIAVNVTAGAGTEGEGRFLIDKNPANVLSTGSLTGGNRTGDYLPEAIFSGTNFAVSTFFRLAQAILPAATNMAPGTVTVPIMTSGGTPLIAVNTAAAPSSGTACISDPIQGGGASPSDYEMANYTVSDDTHLTLTLNKPHAQYALVAIGGLCGYGLEQTADTTGGIRQVFPVLGSLSATELYYTGGVMNIIAATGTTSSYANISMPITQLTRSSGTVTMTVAGSMLRDLNGLQMTITGAADPTYNGTFTVTTTGPSTLTYSQAGANSTSSGGTVSLLTGGYALYPMAEVLGTYDAATSSVDGTLTLAPNTVQWAANDAVEEPHFFQQKLAADVEEVDQTMPRANSYQSAGVHYGGNVGPGLRGWEISNMTPVTNYYGNGGTHTAPDMAFHETGVWNSVLDMQAGELSVFNVHCNSHGCARWDSGYSLFQMDAAGSEDEINFNPSTHELDFVLAGTDYSLTPTTYALPGMQYGGAATYFSKPATFGYNGTPGAGMVAAFGSAGQTTVDGGGVVRAAEVGVNGLSYTWPSTQAAGALTNDGSGHLVWTATGPGGNGLTAANLQTTLAAGPFSMTVNGCADGNGDGTEGLAFESASGDGTPTCNGLLTTDGNGSLHGYEASGGPAFKLNNDGSAVLAGGGMSVTTSGYLQAFGLNASNQTINLVANGIAATDAATVGQLPVAATASTAGTVKLAAGQTSATLAKVATTGAYGDLSGLPAASTTVNGQVCALGGSCVLTAGNLNMAAYLASPPVIGGTAAAAVNATTLTATNAGNAGTFNDTNTILSGTYGSTFSAFGPNMALGGNVYWSLGLSATPNNAYSPIFHYAGSGSTNNSYCDAFNSGAVLSCLWANGDKSIGNNTDPGTTLGVGSANQMKVDAGGNITAPTVKLDATQSTVAGSTGGTAIFTEPEQGVSDKKVLIYLNGLNGTASYSFPAAFSYTPAVLNTNGLPATLVTSVNTASVTVTGAGSTGFLILEGF